MCFVIAGGIKHVCTFRGQMFQEEESKYKKKGLISSFFLFYFLNLSVSRRSSSRTENKVGAKGSFL